MKLFPLWLLSCLLLLACKEQSVESPVIIPETPFLVVLGIAQDAGYPQMGCEKTCCTAVWTGQEDPQFVSAIGLVDPPAQKKWLFDATPDMREQLELFQQYALSQAFLPDGIFLTHAHIGHYTGLMQLGREVMGAERVPVWAMPRMDTFLRKNGPWGQLVNLQNIDIQGLINRKVVSLSEQIQVQPIQVPHRDEYSETVGFLITGPNRSAWVIPDIAKWERWEESIVDYVEKVDYLLLDGTFFANGEIPNRDMSEIPHPFITESMNLFVDQLEEEDRRKIIFTHFNHTNPMLWNSEERKQVEEMGFGVARMGQIFEL